MFDPLFTGDTPLAPLKGGIATRPHKVEIFQLVAAYVYDVKIITESQKGPKMIKVTATQLRRNLFDYLDRVAAGETIVITRKNAEAAYLAPAPQKDWRDAMTIKPKLLASPEKLIEPIEEIWEDYI